VFVGPDRPDLAGIVPGSAWIVVPFAIGTVVRLGRESGVRQREERARQVAYEERLRVAQEVHDVVGHGLAAITMQADVALHVLAKRPEQAVTALTAISQTSRAALDELRATLTLLRRDGESRAAPSPGVDQLGALAERVTRAGVPVIVRDDVPPVQLPGPVQLAVYRIVQESLTNVLRHAGPATATVSVRQVDGRLDVEVVDTGRGPVPGGQPPGHGIAGMRERAVAVGGTLRAGPASGGGFAVHAVLPIPSTAEVDAP
jgi:signal transduction histidine kinase